MMYLVQHSFDENDGDMVEGFMIMTEEEFKGYQKNLADINWEEGFCSAMVGSHGLEWINNDYGQGKTAFGTWQKGETIKKLSDDDGKLIKELFGKQYGHFVSVEPDDIEAGGLWQ